MLLLILLVLVLLLVLVMLPGRFLTEQIGPQGQMGARDHLPEPSIELGRSRRALANFQETFPVFMVPAVLSLIYGEQGWLSLAGATIYLLARIAHAFCYMRAISPWRSISFLISLIGCLGVIIPLIPHIWG